jgi:hypothetical protein
MNHQMTAVEVVAAENQSRYQNTQVQVVAAANNYHHQNFHPSNPRPKSLQKPHQSYLLRNFHYRPYLPKDRPTFYSYTIGVFSDQFDPRAELSHTPRLRF